MIALHLVIIRCHLLIHSRCSTDFNACFNASALSRKGMFDNFPSGSGLFGLISSHIFCRMWRLFPWLSIFKVITTNDRSLFHFEFFSFNQSSPKVVVLLFTAVELYSVCGSHVFPNVWSYVLSRMKGNKEIQKKNYMHFCFFCYCFKRRFFTNARIERQKPIAWRIRFVQG